MKLLQRFFKLNIIVLFSVIASACITNQHANDNQEPAVLWQQHQHDLMKINTFQLNGSLAYFSAKTRYYGRLFINQSAPNTYDIKLTSPVGTSIFSLVVTPYMAELTDSDGAKYRDENVEQLVDRLTNMKIPLKALSQWLIGFADNSANDQINTSGLLYKTTLNQANQTWNMTISKYTTARLANNTIELPSVIELVNHDDKLRLTINNWKLN